MKIISKIRILINHLFGRTGNDNTSGEVIDSPISFPYTPEDNTDRLEDEVGLDVPPPLISDIISPEPTPILEIETSDYSNDEVSERNQSSCKDTETNLEAQASLSSKKFEELLEHICLSIEEFDKKTDSFEKISGNKVYKFIRSKLTDRLMQSGASIIKDEDSFDLLRHNPVEISEQTEEGCKIAETIRPGIEYGGKVYLRAIVKLENV